MTSTPARMINVYTTSHRGKARSELKRAGIKPFTPKEFGGLIAANDRPREAAYVHSKIGRVARDEFARMYARSTRTMRVHKFKAGQVLGHSKGVATLVPCIVREVCGDGWYRIEFRMMGKTFRHMVREGTLVIDPQIRYEPG